MVTIIAVRHGETVENAKGLVGGHIPGKLNSKGIAQAREAAEKLSRRRIDAIYSSDLARAADTADIIAKRHPHLKVVYVRALREKNLGELQGKPRPDGAVHYLGMRTKHGETLGEFRKRVKRFLDRLAARCEGKTVLLVTHGGTIRAIRTIVDGTPSSHMVGGKRIKNTEIQSFNYKK